jgi:hypothetical protein
MALASALTVLPLSAAQACYYPGYENLKPKPIQDIIARQPIVFVGTVIRDNLRNTPFKRIRDKKAVFKVEIPIKGVTRKTIEIRQGAGPDCRHRFGNGDRWLIAGDRNGVTITSGSLLLNRKRSDDASDEMEKARRLFEEDLKKSYPEILKLPSPEATKPRNE